MSISCGCRLSRLLIIRSLHVFEAINSRLFKNLVLHYIITEPNQVWVADIIYIVNRKNPSYLSVIMDSYPKKIVGNFVGDNLNTEIVGRHSKWHWRIISAIESLIYHSDKGMKHCSNEYQKILEKHNVKCSIT